MGLPKVKTSSEEWSDVISALKGVGLSDSEIAIYQASISLGPRPASIIAEKAGLKRSHTYNILSAMKEKGIVQELIKNSVRHFSCCPPSSLVGLIENQIIDMEQSKKNLESALPLLQGLLGGLSRQPKVRFFQGKQGIRDIFEDILRTPNDGMFSIVDLQYSWSSIDEDMRHWVQNFIERREEKDIWWNAVAVGSEESDRELSRRSASKRRVKRLDGMSIPAEINIYGSKVALTSTSEEMIGVVIESGPIAECLKNIHQYLWLDLPTYKVNGKSVSELE